MVHLSETIEDAVAVASRRTERPTVLRILATQAAASGLSFYREGHVYLVEHVPAQFIVQDSPAQGPSD